MPAARQAVFHERRSFCMGRPRQGNTAGQSFDNDIDPNATEVALFQSDSSGTAVFNFAIARVRYRALVQDATTVRVFFRLFPALTVSLAYDTATTYRRWSDGTLGGRVGLLRYGDSRKIFPQGWQLDVEAAAIIRMMLDEIRDWAKRTLPTYEARKVFFEDIVNGDLDDVIARARGAGLAHALVILAAGLVGWILVTR